MHIETIALPISEGNSILVGYLVQFPADKRESRR
jgi:hypothetical protein